MRRREFIAGLGGAAAWPLRLSAQQSLPVVGYVNGASATVFKDLVAAFRQGLSEAGYIDGRNVTLEYRWAEGHYDRLPAMISELVRLHVDVMFANTPAVVSAMAATTTIPIVFVTGGDPVESGFVTSLSRPDRRHDRCTSEPGVSECRDTGEGGSRSGSRTRSTNSNLAREHRAGN